MKTTFHRLSAHFPRLRFGLVLAILVLCAGAASADPGTKGEAAKSEVAVFRLSGSLVEAPQDQAFPFGDNKVISLHELVDRMKKAEGDKDVKAVAMSLESIELGRAQVEELRQAMSQLRAAGKEIYAFADSLDMQDYLLLAGATRVSVAPTGIVWVGGIHGEAPYLRGLLNKIGVTPDFITCGEYKSAAEVFMREGPSPKAEEMTNWLLDSVFDSSIKSIARGRGVDEAKVRGWIDGGIYTAEKAHELGMIDAVEHRQEFEAGVKRRFDGNPKFVYRYGEKAQAQFDFSSPMGILSFYADLLGGGKKTKSAKDAIAIVYVEGPIVLGSSETSILDPGGSAAASTPIRKALDKAADDDTIKGVVLRVNSPGGSATASEIILNATKRVKSKKPLVVSMGNVAGSGGYYVACGADTIFADASTITGSIGVLGGKFATTPMWNSIGITWKEYNRGANADLLSSARTFTPEQKKKLQGWMDEIYGVFKGHVTAIRGDRLKKPIDDLAGGRVYTGRQALDLGLVDKLGTLDDAIKFAAEKAKIEKYEVRVVPEPKSLMELLMRGMNGGEGDDADATTATIGGPKASLINAALPYLRGLDPARMQLIGRSMRQLETLNHEGAVLTMPELMLSGSREAR
jgi:protease-4